MKKPGPHLSITTSQRVPVPRNIKIPTVENFLKRKCKKGLTKMQTKHNFRRLADYSGFRGRRADLGMLSVPNIILFYGYPILSTYGAAIFSFYQMQPRQHAVTYCGQTVPRKSKRDRTTEELHRKLHEFSKYFLARNVGFTCAKTRWDAGTWIR